MATRRITTACNGRTAGLRRAAAADAAIRYTHLNRTLKVLVAGFVIASLSSCHNSGEIVKVGASQKPSDATMAPSTGSIQPTTTSPKPKSPSPSQIPSSPKAAQSAVQSPSEVDELREKPIDEFRLVRANRTEIVVDLDTTNRGCSPERFADMKWERNGQRIGVRAFYRDLGGTGACALFKETHTLTMAGPWEPGTYTVFAPFPGSKAAELTVLVV